MNSLGLCKISEIGEKLIEENFKKCSVYDYKCTMACGSLVLLFGCGVKILDLLYLNIEESDYMRLF